jgi:hypothetical protein
MMRVLLEAGADPQQKFWYFGDEMMTAAVVACFTANAEMLELMLQFEVSANDAWKIGDNKTKALLSVAVTSKCEKAVS